MKLSCVKLSMCEDVCVKLSDVKVSFFNFFSFDGNELEAHSWLPYRALPTVSWGDLICVLVRLVFQV